MSTLGVLIIFCGVFLGLGTLAPVSAAVADPHIALNLYHDLPVDLADASTADPDLADHVVTPISQGRTINCNTETTQLMSDRFRFDEEAQRAGCGYARFTLAVPAGAEALRVSFASSRQSTATDDSSGTRLGFLQELRIIPPNGSGSPLVHRYVDNVTLDMDLTNFSFVVTNPAAGDTTIEWWFQDLGQYATEGGIGSAGWNSYRADVFAPRAEVIGIHILPSVAEPLDRFVKGKSLVLRERHSFAIPQNLFEPQYGNESIAAFGTIYVPYDFSLPHLTGVTSTPEWMIEPGGGKAARFTYDHRSGPPQIALSVTRAQPLQENPLLVPLAILIMVAAPGTSAAAYVYWRTIQVRAPLERTPTTLRRAVVTAAFGMALTASVLATKSFVLIASWPLGRWGVLILGASILVFGAGVVTVEGERRYRGRSAEQRRRALAAQMTDLQTFVDGVTHDMKTPILTIQWLTQDLEHGLKEAASDPQLAETLNHVRNSVGGLEALVQDLLLLSKVQKGELDRKRLAIKDVVDHVFRDLAPSAERRGTRLEATVSEGIHVEADRRLFGRALANLVGNAIKYGRENGWVEVLADHTAEDVTIHIDDDGPGVPPEDRDQLFELFQRGRTKGPGAPEGTGLGLAIVKGIVERHGGHVTVGASPLGGARFSLRLPSATTPQP